MRLTCIAALLASLAALSPAARLPDKYFELVAGGLAEVQKQLAAQPRADLARISHTNFGKAAFQLAAV